MPLPFTIPPVLEHILGPLLKKFSAGQAAARLAKVRHELLTKMDAENVLELGTRPAVRWCLYYQCKALLAVAHIQNGTLADLWRDHVDDKVLAAIGAATFSDDQSCYDRTAKELIDLVW